MSELLKGQPGERRLFLGNEAIVRGALEAGVALVSTYPGTPASEIGDRCYEISRQTDLYFEYSVNEKVALEVAAGAAASGWRSLCAMKHVGLNVAADALMTLAYVGVQGGLVIVSADDPSMFSSQNEQDNRYYAKMAGLPLLEPANPQEAKEMTLAAFSLSEALKLPVLLRTTTRVNHTRGPVTLGPLAPRPGPGFFQKDPFTKVMIPAVARQAHVRLLLAETQARVESEGSVFNQVSGRGAWGIVTSGVAGCYVADAVQELGLADRVRVLKLGFTHPLPEDLIAKFLAPLTRVLVVEELEPFLEEGIRGIAQARGLTLPIRGKAEGLFSRLYEYHPGLVKEKIARYFGLPYEPPAPPAPEEVLGRAAAGPAPQSLPRLPPPGHVLLRQDCPQGPGSGRHLSHRHRLLHPGAVAAPVHGRLSHLHGIKRQHRRRHRQVHRPEGGGLHRGLHLFPLRAAGPGQRGAPEARLPAGHPGQRHHRHDRPSAPPRSEPGAPRVSRGTRPH